MAHKRFYASDAVGIFIARDIQQETKQNIKDYYNTAMKIKKYVNRLEQENRQYKMQIRQDSLDSFRSHGHKYITNHITEKQ